MSLMLIASSYGGQLWVHALTPDDRVHYHVFLNMWSVGAVAHLLYHVLLEHALTMDKPKTPDYDDKLTINVKTDTITSSSCS